MLIKAAINGARTQEEHPAIPITPTQQAEEAAAAVAAGAGAIHVHVRDPEGRESLAPEDVADTLELPDGSRAKSNAELVAAAYRIVAEAVSL